MATRLPEFMQRRVARRTGSDITNLAKNFQVQSGNLADQYQTEFAKYQQMVNEKMGAYETQAAAYRTALDNYTTNVTNPYMTALADFESRSRAYQQELDAINSGARDIIAGSTKWEIDRNFYQTGFIDPRTGQRVGFSEMMDNPTKYGYSDIFTPVETGRRGRNEYTFRPLPTTAAPKPVERPEEFKMEKPTAPEIAAFDGSQFEEKKKQLRSEFDREIGERKSARLGAVQRKSRTLLGGVKA